MKEFDIDVITGYSFTHFKRLEPDVVKKLRIGGNLTFDVNKDFDIPRDEYFNIVTNIKEYVWGGQKNPEILKVRLHNCRVCSIAYRKDYNSVQINYKAIEVFGPINWRDRKIKSIIKNK